MNPYPSRIIAACVLAASLATAHGSPREIPLNQGWSFHRVEANEATPPDGPTVSGTFNDTPWERVSLPHTARLDSP